MSRETSPMIAPPINILKYNVNNSFGDQLLLGIALDLPSLNDQINTSLKKIRAIKGRLPTLDTPSTQQ